MKQGIKRVHEVAEQDYCNSTKKIKLPLVQLILIDLEQSNNLHLKLQEKMIHQSKGFSKWFRARELFRSHMNQYRHVPIEFMNDKHVVIDVAINYPSLFSSLVSTRDKWTSDKDVMTAAIIRNHFILAQASQELRDDPEILILALRYGNPSCWLLIG